MHNLNTHSIVALSKIDFDRIQNTLPQNSASMHFGMLNLLKWRNLRNRGCVKTVWPHPSPLKQVSRPSGEKFPIPRGKQRSYLQRRSDSQEESEQAGCAKFPWVYHP